MSQIYVLSVCTIHSRQILDPSRFLGSFSIDSWHISQSIKVILCALCQLDSNSIASWSIETLLHALFFTCFASFYYLVIHNILFDHIHTFIWIPCVPLIILDHLYVFRVKPYSFLYLLSIMIKKGRKCGFFLRFYMLGREIHAFVRGSVYLLVVLGAPCTPILWPYLHILCLSLIYIIYDDICLIHLSLHVLFLLYLYTHVSLCMQSLFMFHTWYLDEFCLSVSEKKVVKVYHAVNSFLAKFFKSL